jgi:nitrite reductase/ring-hydroxylating ferredoxin subunit
MLLFAELGATPGPSSDVDSQVDGKDGARERSWAAMLGRFFKRLGKKPALVKGTHKLEEGNSKVVNLGDPMAGGVQVVLSRIDGVIYALDTHCPHEQGRIVGGPLHDGNVLCPLHNYLFDAKTGETRRGVCSGAKTYVAEEKDGDCEVWI